MKSIIWLGSSYKDLLAFPDDARRTAGFQLDKVQRGQAPDDWKPMTAIGAGVREIRIRESSGAFRVMYVADMNDCIHVLHAFQKKSQKTSLKDIRLARSRYKAIGDKDEQT